MRSTRYVYLIFFVFFIGCAEKNKNNSNTITISNNNVPATRKNVNKEAVASYIIPMGDPKLDRKFGVEIYETPSTFKYLLNSLFSTLLPFKV